MPRDMIENERSSAIHTAETVEEKVGREFDLQEMHINLVSLGGNVDEDDDEFVIAWST